MFSFDLPDMPQVPARVPAIPYVARKQPNISNSVLGRDDLVAGAVGNACQNPLKLFLDISHEEFAQVIEAEQNTFQPQKQALLTPQEHIQWGEPQLTQSAHMLAAGTRSAPIEISSKWPGDQAKSSLIALSPNRSLSFTRKRSRETNFLSKGPSLLSRKDSGSLLGRKNGLRLTRGDYWGSLQTTNEDEHSRVRRRRVVNLGTSRHDNYFSSDEDQDGEGRIFETKSSRVGSDYQCESKLWNDEKRDEDGKRAFLDGQRTEYDDEKVNPMMMYSKWKSAMQGSGLSCTRHNFMQWRRAQGDAGILYALFFANRFFL